MIEYRGLLDVTVTPPSGSVPLRFVNCENVRVNPFELYNINYGNMLAVDSCKDMTFYEPHFRDGTLTSTTPGSQLTAIGIDGNPEGSSYCDKIRFEKSDVRRLIVPPSVYAALGNRYETDAANVAHPLSREIWFDDPYWEDIGEGFDGFGVRCRVRGGKIYKAHQIAIKMIHGATRTRIEEVEICWFGMHGVLVHGSASSTRHSDRNIIRGVDASVANFEGKYTENDNTAFACVAPAGCTTFPKNSLFDTCSSDKTAKWDIFSNAPVGSGNEFMSMRRMRSANIYNTEGALIS